MIVDQCWGLYSKVTDSAAVFTADFVVVPRNVIGRVCAAIAVKGLPACGMTLSMSTEIFDPFIFIVCAHCEQVLHDQNYMERNCGVFLVVYMVQPIACVEFMLS
ncbi:hypothetical protein MTO96_007448 [Rhipicephalus appendiculatus]